MILGYMSHTNYPRSGVEVLIRDMIVSPQFEDRYLPLIFDGPTENNALRNSKVKMLSDLVQKHKESSDKLDLISSTISDLLDRIDPNVVFSKLVRYTMKMRTLGMSKLLLRVDFSLLEWPSKYNGHPADRLKNIAFQLGQTLALIPLSALVGMEEEKGIMGVELFTKNTIATRYPELGPLLRREKIEKEQLICLNKMMVRYIDAIDTIGLSDNVTENTVNSDRRRIDG
jgi:hypothetical protein